jgi:hypothetical protein
MSRLFSSCHIFRNLLRMETPGQAAGGARCRVRGARTPRPTPPPCTTSRRIVRSPPRALLSASCRAPGPVMCGVLSHRAGCRMPLVWGRAAMRGNWSTLLLLVHQRRRHCLLQTTDKCATSHHSLTHSLSLTHSQPVSQAANQRLWCLGYAGLTECTRVPADLMPPHTGAHRLRARRAGRRHDRRGELSPVPPRPPTPATGGGHAGRRRRRRRRRQHRDARPAWSHGALPSTPHRRPFACPAVGRCVCGLAAPTRT